MPEIIPQTPPPTATKYPFGILEGTHWIEHLRDDTPVLIRPLRADDREREEALIKGLSPNALRFRFLGSFKQASTGLIDQLMDVDYKNRMAFVALAHDDGILREVGVSRYSAGEGDKRCECAITVADDWHHRGLGVALMRHLINVARKNGFTQMYSIDASDNEAMHSLASFLGFRRQVDPDEPGQVIHTLDL